MGMRGDQYVDAIRAIMSTFGEAADHFIFLGSCVLGLYMRPTGGPFRRTIDADVISTLLPWTMQEKQLATLCERGIVTPDDRLLCRYHLHGHEIAVDVLSPEGKNVGGITPWFLRAAARASTYALADGTRVRAITPPYFLATKLEAWRDRGDYPPADKDAEDIVAVATEVFDLAGQVDDEGITQDVADLFQSTLEARGLRLADVRDLVSWHLHPIDAAEEDRVVASLLRCAQGA